MKKITIPALRLTQFSKKELEVRQLNALRGGGNPTVCGCTAHCPCTTRPDDKVDDFACNSNPVADWNHDNDNLPEYDYPELPDDYYP